MERIRPVRVGGIPAAEGRVNRQLRDLLLSRSAARTSLYVRRSSVQRCTAYTHNTSTGPLLFYDCINHTP